ncbi:MAG: HYR domain-containing protein, partial [Saprospiraceae bacterium]|nr:HYR domain-containing protein [Saprospiraceae bacterium]
MFTKTYTSLCPVAIASGNTNPATFANLIGFLRSRSLTLLTLWIWVALGLSQALAQPGECLDFDGSNDIVTIADGTWNDFGSSDFTVEAWVKKQAGSTGWSNLAAVGKWNTGGSPGTNEWLMSLTSDGADEKPTFWVEIGTSVYKAIGTTSMTVGTWYHIACVREGTDIKLYVNGTLEATTAIGMTSINNVSGRDVKLARIDGFGGHTNMEMDELRVWDDARSAAEISYFKDCEIPAVYTDLLANYHFNQGTAGGSNPGETSLDDDAGSSRDGTLTGFALTGGTSNWVAPGPTPNGVSCLPVHNLTQDLYYSTIQDAVDAANSADVIECSPATYAERVTIDKSLTLQGTSEATCILDGASLMGPGSGIKINSGITDVTIKRLTIKNYAGTAPNSYAGIYAIGSNDDLTVMNCTIKDNVGGCGFYANGPVSGVDLQYLTVSGHPATFGAARGIVIWNGLKQNITIKYCEVYNNNCCGIELQDGTCSNVDMSNNDVYDNGDSGMSAVGLTGSIGPNTISSNTLNNNGRFGIEIKNPDGDGTDVTISGNTVTITGSFAALRPVEERDIAGIAVFRRGVLAGNVDVPTGVIVTGNTVSGYVQDNGASTSEGFGIVVEGTNHSVSGNTCTGNDVGMQQQAGHLPYPGDGDQSDLADSYFGRGNAPFSCGNVFSGNTLSGNGDNSEPRNVGSIGGAGFVVNTNTGETFCTLQKAIDDANTLGGHVLDVTSGTFTENVSITKSLILRGANYGTDGCSGGRGSESIVDGAAGTAFSIMASGVVIDGFEIRGATGVSSSGYTGVSVRNNKFAVDGVGISVSSAATSPGSTWAIEDNCIDLAAQLFGGTPTYGILLAGISGTAAATVDGNDISDAFYGYIGYGVVTTPVTRIENGSVTGAMQGVALVNTLGGPLAPIDIEIVSLSLTSFSGSHPGLPAVNFHAGVYTYTAGSTTPLESIDAIIRACTIDGTGSVSPAGAAVYIGDFSAGPAIVQTIEVDENTIIDNLNRGVDSRGFVSTTITQNTFSGNGSAPWGTGGNDGFTIIARNGASVTANNNFITHPASSTYPVTALFTGNAPVSTIAASDNSILMNGNAMAKGANSAAGTGSIDAECNWWGVTGSSVPPLMSGTVDYELFLTSGVDDDLGTAGFQPQANSCNGCSSGNLVTNTNTGEFFCTIQDAIDDAETLDGHTLDVSAGTYAEDVLVDKELTIRGPNHSIDPCSGMRVPEAIVVPKTKDIASTVLFYIAANTDDVTIEGFTMDGDNPLLTSGFSSTNGADIDAAEAVATYETGVDNLVVKNNIIKNLSFFGVTHYDYPAGVASSGHEISNNKFLDLGTYDAGSGISFWGGGVLLYNNGYAHVHDNCMTNVRIGVQTGNFYSSNPGTSTYQRIEDNTMSVRRRGIFHNLFYSAASPYTLDDNTITAVSHASEIYWDGILVASHQGVSSTTSNNDIDGSAADAGRTTEGLEVWNVRSTAPAIISGGTVTGVDIGLFVNNYEGYVSDAGEGAHTTVSGLVATDCPIGAKIFDSPSSTLHAAVTATIKDDCEFNHSSSGTTGILVSGAAATATIKDNDASIDGYSIGVDVDAATATVENNHIYNNGIGVRFTNGGDGTVTKNKFYDAAEPNGTDVQKTATGGSVTAGPDNWYAGSTYGVENLSATSIDATLNYWNAANGPGPVGSGSGTPITTLVDYCQYLNDEPTHLGGSPTATSPTVVILVDESSGVADDDGIICNGASVTLDATTTGATGYLWSTTATTASITVSPSSTTGYTVTVTFPDCTVSDDQTITVEALPSCSITGADGPLCPSASETYAGPAGMSSYSWSITGSGTIPGSTSDPTVSVSASATCSGSFTLTLVITDGDGCSSSCSKVVTVEDVTGPTVTTGSIATCYPTLAAAEAAALTATTATDNCPGALTETPITTGTSCSATISVTVTDACGNSNTAIYSTRIDGAAPVFTTCPIDIAVYTAPGLCGRSVTYPSPTATDNCTASPTIAKTDMSGYMSGDFFPVGTTPQTFSATDECGNSSTCSFTVTVIDDEDPVITGCPPNITVNTTTGLCTGTATWVAPTASDNCPGVSLTLVPYLPPSSTFPKGSTLLTYTATDVSTNSVTCIFTVVVEDNEDPTITGCPGNQTRDADSGECDYTAVGTEFDPTSYDDNCPMEVLTYALSGATTGSGTNTLAGVDFQKGTTTVVWTVTDMSGNTASCTFNVVVSDIELPTISCPSNPQSRNTNTGVCTYTAVAGEFDPTFADNCPMATISNNLNASSTLAGHVFAKGTTLVIWTVTDMSGNMASCTFNVVVSDIELPTISCPSNPQSRNTNTGVCTYTAVAGEFDPTF